MQNTLLQIFLPIAAIFVSLLAGIFFNNQNLNRMEATIGKRIDDLDTKLGQRLDRVEARLTLIEQDQKQFFTVTGKLDGRIDELSRH